MQKTKSNNFADFISYPDSGWYRVNSNDVIIFFHVDAIPKKDNPSHRHGDLTSFVLYFKGQPILVDPGRYNYCIGDPIGCYGYSARAHNSLTVDKLEPQAGINNRRFPDFYRSSNVITNYSICPDQFQFEVEHNGFCRLFGDSIVHNRIFKLSNGHFRVIDKLKGKNKHKINTYFQWGPNLTLTENDYDGFDVNSHNKQLFKGIFKYKTLLTFDDIKLDINNSNGMGLYFPNYGVKEKIVSMNFSQKVKLPINNEYSLRWKV